MSAFTAEQLAALQHESPQQPVDPFAEIKSEGVFTQYGILNLYPALIPGWHKVDYPVASYGVNADETAGAGIGWLILFHSYELMAAQDTIRLYMGKRLEPGQVPDPTEEGTLIKTVVVPSDHNNQDVLSFIPRGAIERPGIHRLWYTVERTSGNGPESSDGIVVWFKPTFPDSLDPTGNSSERVPLQAPEFPSIIDQAMVERGVDFIIPRWPIMSPGDTVLMTVGNQLVAYVIKPEEIDQDITIFVPSSVLELIGPAKPLLVSYRIHDQVHNSSHTSKIGDGELVPDKTYLDMCWVNETVDDVLFIDTLDGHPMEVVVPVKRGDAITGDTVELKLYDPRTEFSRLFGPLIYRTPSVTFPVPYAVVKQLAPATITLSYERIRIEKGEKIRTPSYPYSPELIGEKYRGPAPTAPQAHGGVLSPDLAETVVYVGPDIKGLEIGDKVTLTCLSTSAGGTTRLQIEERFVTRSMVIPGAGIIVPFEIDTRHFDTYLSGSFKATYTVTGENHLAPLESHALLLHIGPVQDTLDVVNVGKDENGVLDPKDIPFGTPAICPAKAHTQVGDTVYLQVWTADDRLVWVDSLPITAAHIGKDIEFRLTFELIDSLNHQVIRIDWYIERNRALPLTAPELELRVGDVALELPPPTLVEVSSGNRINPRLTEKSTTVEITYKGMSAAHRIALIVIGRAGLGSPVVATQPGNANGTLLIELPLTTVPANLRHFMKLRYRVSQPELPDQYSGVTTYEVTAVPDEAIVFPSLSIAQAPDHKTLDLSTFQGDARWSLARWLFIAIGTRMRVALGGSNAAGADHPIILFDGVITADHVTSGLSGVINRQQLELFKDGGQVMGLSIANFNNKGGVDTFFPVRELTLLNKTWSLLINRAIDANTNASIPNGGSTKTNRVTLSGTGKPDSTLTLFQNDNVPKPIDSFKVPDSGNWSYTVTVTASSFYRLTVMEQPTGRTSNLWTFSVLAPEPAPVRPHILLALNARGQSLYDYQHTRTTGISVNGVAAPGAMVQILLNGIVVQDRVYVGTNGFWQSVLFGVGSGTHQLSVRGLYGNYPVSLVFTQSETYG
ncbi:MULTISPECIES: hypothetical protein [Pseudomonas]|uniref:hypothetical protein n=1 Tax=Pseudomonas TaxID=286 RepID=UPI000B34F0AE|nr:MULTISPECIES: hypothetical protein [Pseudomonas]MDR7107810.1 hypothetical protein [Pseudomonas frederiksbergensis]PMY51299.1 hypothetical protein C1X70_16790 [Pseudomonas sp. FW305-53]PMY84361.1 hypothetical protein C1X68_24750 [Pseudomonas sp. FW303-C2]PMY90404.1 hypothetical protein C1X67_23730 [Pseudomonas sp. FW305-62]PNA41347.1 hypothetical protein C1X71_19755 [Pseudomonas sp. FW306-2-2C-A10BC]